MRISILSLILKFKNILHVEKILIRYTVSSAINKTPLRVYMQRQQADTDTFRHRLYKTKLPCMARDVAKIINIRHNIIWWPFHRMKYPLNINTTQQLFLWVKI